MDIKSLKMSSALGLSLLTQLMCIITNVFGQGNSQDLQISYTMPEEQNKTHLGNIIDDASLWSLYESDTVNSFEFGILQGKYKVNFEVNPANGDFSSDSPLDRESICPFKDACQVTVDVAILKPISHFRVIKVNIEIKDKNDIKPTFPQAVYVLNISETAQPGAQFVIPPAIDQDSTVYSIQAYRLLPDSDVFELTATFNNDQSQDIRLTLIRQLDREQVKSYSMVLKALDGDMPPEVGTMVIQINVVDHNDNSPIFDREIFNKTVAENYPPGMVIATVHAFDLDDGPNGQVRYKLSAQSVALHGDIFEMDQYTGDVILKTELDYETQDVYTLIVQATDAGIGSIPATAKVVIYVQDVNDHKPVLTVSGLSTSGEVEISENAQRGEPFAFISVEDLDKGISGEVTCESLDPALTLEILKPKSYKLVTQRLFDYETESTYHVVIVCRDLGEPQLTSSADISIAIIDNNDNPPIFRDDSYALSIRENNTIGDVILSVSASDRDSGINSELTFRLSENARDLLEVSDSGIIRAKVVLDHEQMAVFKFTVMATDGGSPPLSTSAPVILTLIDINDEAPHFSKESYSFGTFENQDVGTLIGIIDAQDRDSPPYDEFTFSLDTSIGGATVNSFHIDPRLGKITTKKVLDREHIPTHLLKVWAINTASPSLSSSVNVTVHVADKNDNAPLIIFPNKDNRTVQVPTNAMRGYVFSRINASDADLAENAKLDFSIAGGNSENLFDIDYFTGALSVKGDLSQAQSSEYEVLVVVKDEGESPKKAVAIVHVVINSSLIMTYQPGLGDSTPGIWDDDGSFTPIISPSHQKILIVLGVVTTILVIVLVAAIIYIRRRQTLQERDMVQNVYKVEVCRSEGGGGDESAPLDNMQNEFKVKVDPDKIKTTNCIEGGRTHLTLEDLKRMKCLYRDRPDITQNVPAINSPGSPVITQSQSYSSPPAQKPNLQAPYDGILDLLERQPVVNRPHQQDAESTGSNTDSGRGTSEPAHDLSGGSNGIGGVNNRNSSEDFIHLHHTPQNAHNTSSGSRTLGNLAPIHVYLKDKNNGGGVVGVRMNNRQPPTPSYTDASQRPTHYTFQSPATSPMQKQPVTGPPALPVKQQQNESKSNNPSCNSPQTVMSDNKELKSALKHSSSTNNSNHSPRLQSSNHGLSPFMDRSRNVGNFSSFKGGLDNSTNKVVPAPRPSSEISESCDNISLASTTSGEYVIQMDNGPLKSVNV